MDYLTTTLANGLRIVHRYTESPVSYCGFMIDAGTRDENVPDRFGMAHFIEHILFKGTQRRNAWHISNRMEAVGGELNAFTTKEDTTIYSVFLQPDFDRACELLCDLVCHPLAPISELKREQEVVVEEINAYRDNPPELIYDEFEDRIFAGHPLGHNILGTEESVRAFDTSSCLQFIAEHYLPSRMVFFSCGRTPWKHVVRMVEKYFDRAEEGTMGNRSSHILLPWALRGESLIMGTGEKDHTSIIEKETHQAHVMLGAISYPIGSPKAAALALLNNILGGPCMNSRLNQELREHRGLVYTVESTLTNYTDTGLFNIYFGCDHQDVDRCLGIVRTQLHHMREKLLSSSRLRAAQKQFKGQLGVGSSNQENAAINLGKSMLRFGRCESLEETYARIDAITPSLARDVANEVFDEEGLYCVIIK